MRKITTLTLAIAAVVFLEGSTCWGQEKVPRPTETVQALIQTHCVACHNDKTSKGGLRLDTFAARGWGDYDLLDEMLARIEDGEMPPTDAKKQLVKADKTALLGLMKARLDSLEGTRLVGKYRKLTAQEYSNTLADVFGQPVERLQDLPFDSRHPFKKLGEHQVVTSYALKKYYAVAQHYLDDLILHEPIVAKTTTFSPKDVKRWVPQSYSFPIGVWASKGNRPSFLLRNPVSRQVEEGEYELIFDWHCFYLPRKVKRGKLDQLKNAIPTKSLQPPRIHVAAKNGVRVLSLIDAKQNSTCSIAKPIRVVLDKETKFLGFRGPWSRFTHPVEKDPRYAAIEKSNLGKNEKRAAAKALGEKIHLERHGDRQMHLLITGATLRGPVNKPEPAAHARIFGIAKRDSPFEVCPPIIERLAKQLYRRPVSARLTDRYIAIAREEYDSSRNAYLAVKVALNAMLCSPHFLFKYEGNQEKLDDYMIAARLSYFLWNSTPDEQLLALAAAGKLQEPAVRRAQAKRLLADRTKSERFTKNFTHQWLGLHKFGNFTPNTAYINPGHFAQVKQSIADEPQAFFNEVLYGNLSALNFIDSDFVVWDRGLYQLCGGSGLKVRLDRDADAGLYQRTTLQQNPERIRGGLMTMPAIMSLTTDGENTQPILRGVWVARHLLGMEINPPATVPAIEINLENVSKPREVLAKHKEDRSCYACHVKFDYLGLALENYDVLGRFKTDYVHPVLNEKSRFVLVKKDPIDSLSETPDGKPMPGVKGLKAHLMANKDIVMRNLVEKLCGYAWGREPRYRDRGQIKALLQGMRENDYKLQDLILVIVAADSFAKR